MLTSIEIQRRLIEARRTIPSEAELRKLRHAVLRAIAYGKCKDPQECCRLLVESE